MKTVICPSCKKKIKTNSCQLACTNGFKILSCNICAINREQFLNLNPRLYGLERNHFACSVELCIDYMIQTACRSKEIDIWCFYLDKYIVPVYITIFFCIWFKNLKKLDLNYIHSHEILIISVIIFFGSENILYFYKRNWTMDFLILKWEKRFFYFC